MNTNGHKVQVQDHLACRQDSNATCKSNVSQIQFEDAVKILRDFGRAKF